MKHHITTYNQSTNCDAYIAKNGVSLTLHEDKAASWDNTEDAAIALRCAQQIWPSAMIAERVERGW